MGKIGRYAERVAQASVILALVAFFISSLVYLYFGHWPVTHLDYWRIYEICLTHSWFESALLKVNNHSLFFPSFIWLTDLAFFHGNQDFIFYVGMIFLILIAALLLTQVWRDVELNPSQKLAASLVITLANFWMGRGSILASGGFNCTASLSMLGTILAFVYLPRMRDGTKGTWRATIIVLAGGFLASFSSSTGLSTWPALLILAWCLGMSWKSITVLIIGTLSAALIFVLLPSSSGSIAELPKGFSVLSGDAFRHLCRLLGSPILAAELAWKPKPLPSATEVASSWFSLWCGVFGLVFFLLVLLPYLVRRNLRNKTALIALGLMSANLFVLLLIVIGRASLAQTIPSEVAAPRYFYWSSLFWAGLLLNAIDLSRRRNWLSIPVLLLSLIVLVFVLPKHYLEGVRYRYAACLAQSAATGLISGIHDDRAMAILFRDPKQVYRLATELRARRLDMFAQGYQDWIGTKATNLGNGRHQSERISGECRVDAMPDGDRTAHLTGWARRHNGDLPQVMIVVDPNGTIQGVVHSCSMNKTVNRLFYLNRFSLGSLAGYIRDYNPSVRYVVRSVDAGKLSDETIAVRPR